MPKRSAEVAAYTGIEGLGRLVGVVLRLGFDLLRRIALVGFLYHAGLFGGVGFVRRGLVFGLLFGSSGFTRLIGRGFTRLVGGGIYRSARSAGVPGLAGVGSDGPSGVVVFVSFL